MFDRKSQAAWDARHIRTISCHVTIQTDAVFADIAAERGTTRYGLTKALVLRTVEHPQAALDFLGRGDAT